MGRHRRSAAGSDDPRHAPAHPPSGERPVPSDIGPYPAPDAYAEATQKAQAYLFATDDEPAPAAPGSGDAEDKGTGGDRRWSKAVRPVRAALLGVSVAVVLGTAAVGSGAVPGLEHYRLGGGTHATGGERTGAGPSPRNTASGQGGTSGGVGDGGGASVGSGDGGGDRPARSSSPSPSGTVSASEPSPSRTVSDSEPAPAAPAPARTATGKPSPQSGPHKTQGPGRTKPAGPDRTPGSAKPSASGTPAEPAPEPQPSRPESSAKPTEPKTTPSRTATPSATPSRTPGTPAPAPSSPADTVAREAAVEAEVLKLVNDERAKAGLGALAANSALTGLAEAFSDDMAARGFFAHTDPDGRTPWDRAARAGVTGLGAENIGRGQADAAAVLAAWMDSPENRANILNPGFTAVGAGVHLGPGGPWWTLEFGT
ncbi:CAP domain-containing protein [Streptomyces sp. SudanB182_2057]|uniref:CAP domain-containing protein n=1 Tax=Streptomyces sp. SudanB182_2057 TaxID=3035281 RepID=UPI003F54A3B3